MTAAVALVPRTGWTWLVRVRGDVVEARERLVAVPVLEAELYHLARDHAGDRARFFVARERAARARAYSAIRPALADAKRAIVLGKQPALPALERIVASHAAIHTAEGELWRALFADGCAKCRLDVRRGSLPPPNDARWLARAGEQLGAPWTAEVKAAACAARALVRAKRMP